MNAKYIWQTTIERFQNRLEPAIFVTWFQGTAAHSFQDGILIIRVPTTFVKTQMEKRFHDAISTTVAEITGMPVTVQFEVTTTEPAANQSSPLTGRDPKEKNSPARRPLAKGRLSAVLRAKRNASTIQGQSSQGATSTTTADQKPPSPLATHRGSLDAGKITSQTYQSEQETFIVDRTDEDEDATEPAVPAIPRSPLPLSMRQAPMTRMSMPSKPARTPVFPAAPPDGQSGEAESGLSSEPAIKKSASAIVATFENVLSLNPRYTFKSFIVGKSNQLAHAASLAVSENPGRIYNPLFLYGGVGLGKTHLLHAIGHAGEAAGLTVLYTNSEKFTNEIVNAIRFQKTEEFRAKYRQIDILLVDDIQFIAGKESTEEEFFHTFNTLHNANKQIVVTSDRPPKAINSLQDRLRSRFEWGLLADVQPPEYEHRLAILRSKSESLRFTVPAGVIEYVAKPTYTSVRELEGALNRVIAYATLHDEPLTPRLAARALEHIYESKASVPATSSGGLSVNEVLQGVGRYYNVDVNLLRGKQRERDIVWPRQVAMYLMREETTASLLQIGNALGGRDHTTIMHGWEKVHAEMTSHEHIRHEIAAVQESLHQHSS